MSPGWPERHLLVFLSNGILPDRWCVFSSFLLHCFSKSNLHNHSIYLVSILYTAMSCLWSKYEWTSHDFWRWISPSTLPWTFLYMACDCFLSPSEGLVAVGFIIGITKYVRLDSYVFQSILFLMFHRFLYLSPKIERKLQ